VPANHAFFYKKILFLKKAGLFLIKIMLDCMKIMLDCMKNRLFKKEQAAQLEPTGSTNEPFFTAECQAT
jgi:hypothetical protein